MKDSNARRDQSERRPEPPPAWFDLPERERQEVGRLLDWLRSVAPLAGDGSEMAGADPGVEVGVAATHEGLPCWIGVTSSGKYLVVTASNRVESNRKCAVAQLDEEPTLEGVYLSARAMALDTLNLLPSWVAAREARELREAVAEPEGDSEPGARRRL